MIDVTIQQGDFLDTPGPEVRNPKLLRCFCHEAEECPAAMVAGIGPVGIAQGVASLPIGPAREARRLWGFATVERGTSPSTAGNSPRLRPLLGSPGALQFSKYHIECFTILKIPDKVHTINMGNVKKCRGRPLN